MRALVLSVLLASTALAGCFGGDGDGGVPASDGPGCPKIGDAETRTPLWKLETSMGTIIAELCAEMAPVTVGHFLNLTRGGKFKDASFYRVVGPSEQQPKGFVIQGGVQQAAQALPRVADEFHPLLRHDKAGVLSLAHAGPGTGSSEFFITLDATPHLDDRHSVFGYVKWGLDVVKKIGNVAVDQNDKPTTPVPIKSVEFSRDVEPPAATVTLTSYATIPTRKGEPNEPIQWAIVVRNLGNYIDNITVQMSGPSGWALSTEPGKATQAIPAGKGAVYLVSALPPAGTANGTYNLTAKATSLRNASATTEVPLALEMGDLGPQASKDWRYEVHYVGMTTDGRVFDTTVERVAKDPAIPKFAVQGGFQMRGAYQPVNFSLAAGVIKGFGNLAASAKVGETVSGRLTVADAYATGDVYSRPLTGKPLVFEVTVLRSCATAKAGDAC